MTSRQAAKIPFSFIQCRQLPILDQLRLEEALLRADDRNWCLVNSGTAPAIVMGISGKPEKFIDPHVMARNPVPVIKRFSGGGTVYVDSDTHFVTWICNAAHVGVDCCPVKVHRWSVDFYKAALPMLDVDLRENDYVVGERKWGGNAQYLCKGRWLHHSSLLWDYNESEMQRLLMPSKMPAYRQQRSHTDFLCRLRDFLPSRKVLEDQIVNHIHDRFHVTSVSLEEAQALLQRPHRQGTFLYELHDEAKSAFR